MRPGSRRSNARCSTPPSARWPARIPDSTTPRSTGSRRRSSASSPSTGSRSTSRTTRRPAFRVLWRETSEPTFPRVRHRHSRLPAPAGRAAKHARATTHRGGHRSRGETARAHPPSHGRSQLPRVSADPPRRGRGVDDPGASRPRSAVEVRAPAPAHLGEGPRAGLVRARESERGRLFATLVDESPDGMLALDRAGNVIEMNRAALRLLRLARPRLLGAPVARLLGESAAEALSLPWTEPTKTLTVPAVTTGQRPTWSSPASRNERRRLPAPPPRLARPPRGRRSDDPARGAFRLPSRPVGEHGRGPSRADGARTSGDVLRRAERGRGV